MGVVAPVRGPIGWGFPLPTLRAGIWTGPVIVTAGTTLGHATAPPAAPPGAHTDHLDLFGASLGAGVLGGAGPVDLAFGAGLEAWWSAYHAPPYDAEDEERRVGGRVWVRIGPDRYRFTSSGLELSLTRFDDALLLGVELAVDAALPRATSPAPAGRPRRRRDRRAGWRRRSRSR